MEKTDRDVDEFLASYPDDVREDMLALDRTISAAMGDHARALYTGKFWGGTDQEIIGYGDITYRRPGKPDVRWFIVGVARQKRYISVYVSAVEDGGYLAERYGPALGKVKTGKSSISFETAADIDLDALAALVTRARDLSTTG